jgi:hypothetical protein
MTLLCDNQSVIQLSKDSFQYQHNKHIELHMHFIKKILRDRVLEVHYFPTDDQFVDIFIESLIELKVSKL